jgi:hypothetical protein
MLNRTGIELNNLARSGLVMIRRGGKGRMLRASALPEALSLTTKEMPQVPQGNGSRPGEHAM